MICPSETVDAAGAGSTGIAITGSASKARVAMANRSFLILYLRHPPSRAAHAQKNSSGSSEANKEPLSPWVSSQPGDRHKHSNPVGERPLAFASAGSNAARGNLHTLPHITSKIGTLTAYHPPHPPPLAPGRLLTACRGARSWKTWTKCRLLVAYGRLKDGADVLDAVASACKSRC